MESSEIPESFAFGDSIDWTSDVRECWLYVELPYWLMVPAGQVSIEWSGVTFAVEVMPKWLEIFVGEMTDSRETSVHHGPWPSDGRAPGLPRGVAPNTARWVPRPCKTVLKIRARGHTDVFRELTDDDRPNAKAERETYWTSLCEAHIPVINELIQRYRLATYDYFAFEVSAWDVPVWYLTDADGVGFRAVMSMYKEWDAKPVSFGLPVNGHRPSPTEFEWTGLDALAQHSSHTATPGEFDLLDARSLMERGDYTGAVRRAVTAIEAVAAWSLRRALEATMSSDDASTRLKKTKSNFPARLADWSEVTGIEISKGLLDEFAKTRALRHQIVHQALRLVHHDRWTAMRAVDTGRWLFNVLEQDRSRVPVRETGTLKAIGRSTVAIRFPETLDDDGFRLGPFDDVAATSEAE